jgi:long-chain acyl-CoA synthetase
MSAADDFGGDDAVRADALRARGGPLRERAVPWPSIGALLRTRAREVPERTALAFVDDESGVRLRHGYAALECLTDRCARFLHDVHGVRPGDRIGTLAVNHRDTVLLYLACWKLGAAVVPQNPSEDDARIAFALTHAGCRLAFAMPGQLDRLRAIAASVASLEASEALDADFLARVESTPAEPPAVDEDLRDRDCLIVYTSGTTGAPKGVGLTQYHLMADAEAIRLWLGVRPGDRMMCVLPIHHVNGIVVTLVTPLVAAGGVVLNRGFRASTFWQRLAEERVCIVSVVPTILQYLCEAEADVAALDLSTLRHVVVGAGTLPVALAARFEQRFGVPLLHGYGLSETTAYACMLPRDLDAEAHEGWLTAHGYPSIGCPLPGVEMDILDADGRSLPPGERGEIVLRGHVVMNAYHRRPEANREAFRGGWFHSGDEGMYRLSPDGRRFYFITGRIKELINRGGVKYSPFEIEEVLLACPGVRVALAVAFDNQWYGEEIGAYVVREPGAAVGAEDVLAHCRGRLPHAKCPKVVVFGDEVPVTATGKYQRLKLKPLFAAYAQTQFREPR